MYVDCEKWRICSVNISQTPVLNRILHFTISHKVSVSHEEDKEEALSKDLGMCDDVSCTV
jgi:hypothetical protein